MLLRIHRLHLGSFPKALCHSIGIQRRVRRECRERPSSDLARDTFPHSLPHKHTQASFLRIHESQLVSHGKQKFICGPVHDYLQNQSPLKDGGPEPCCFSNYSHISNESGVGECINHKNDVNHGKRISTGRASRVKRCPDFLKSGARSEPALCQANKVQVAKHSSTCSIIYTSIHHLSK